ncbi:MAG TPA: DUF2935 domain-containing protein [Paenibacillus sp.]|uniref:DUF2935 domain-containing protein n=1 Tax=Paenibacillus sp. TaxID=58172 RepID=UPI002B7C10CE|nr:DUF2935 domain-containing protein [Paenibacillus sp.]HUC92657.1 DUF2935 domain-containing protein [Paenibacillus sp.]
MSDPLFEHRFWLQIMGDHARIIRTALSPAETRDAAVAADFIVRFDAELEEARASGAEMNLPELNRQASAVVAEFKAFKLSLLERLLLGKVELLLTPTFLNHMVNELEEYERILDALANGRPVPVFHPLHYDFVWLLDAAGHAAAIASDLDATEKRRIGQSKAFQEAFEALHIKAIEMAGYMRASLSEFPAFRRFHRDIDLEMKLFQRFLAELEEMQLSAELLDRISPLIPDHMYREECYYLTKLAQTGMVNLPGCDPAKPRVERVR